MSPPQEKARTNIARQVRSLRQERRWTQAQLARQLGMSQSRLSEIERGQGSFTAEQFLAILRIFNVSVTHFAPAPARSASAVQNALARLGAAHLQESVEVLPSEQLDEVARAIREVLIAADNPRHLASLAPVLVQHVDRLNLKRLLAQLAEAGLAPRLMWLVESTRDAVQEELQQALPRPWKLRYRRAELVLNTFLRHDLRPPPGDAPPDVLDADIRSERSLQEVMSASSPAARRWRIATRLQPADFTQALRSAREPD